MARNFVTQRDQRVYASHVWNESDPSVSRHDFTIRATNLMARRGYVEPMYQMRPADVPFVRATEAVSSDWRTPRRDVCICCERPAG